MQSKIEKLPKSTLKITVTVESSKVKEAYEKVLDKAVLETEIEGFRKGSAPKDMVKNKVGTSNLYGDAVDELLQKFYPQALKENLISPVSNPKVEIKEFDLEKDLEFVATVAVRPDIKIGEYKNEMKKRYEEKMSLHKKENEEKLKKGEKLDDSHVHMGSNDVIEALLKNSEVEIADILLDEETDRLMSRLVDQMQTVGLSMESYLKSQDKTAGQLRADYTKIAEQNLKAEFILSKLIGEEKVEVGDKEVDDMIAAVGDDKAKERFKDPMQRLYIKTILQKNKLISKLIEETEGENHHEH
jgi:FKBP-type peptidyl-prolyl cis-trans isomerase (trigger factor)